MDQATVLYHQSDGLAEITLNRPDKLNAFSEPMHQALREVFDQIESDDSVRAVLLTGTGRGFCAGQDLGERTFAEEQKPDLGPTLEQNYNALVRRIRALPLPVVCAVNGIAAGAGANIALACDIVLAARSARFIQAFCKIGLIPDSGGTHSLPHLVGEARAKGLALLGEAIDAETAYQWGLIWQVHDDAALLPEARALATHLAAQPTRALGLIKQAIQAAATNSFDEQLDLERDLQRQAGHTADYREGVRAFLEKRPAAFRGC